MVRDVIRAVVVDSNPAAREGLEAALTAAGIVVDGHPDPVARVREGAIHVVMTAIRRDDDWTFVERLSTTVATPTVVLIDTTERCDQLYHRAFSLGARAALPADLPTRVIADSVRAAWHGLAVVPAELARWPATDRVRSEEEVPAMELEWLRALAHGETVHQVAARAGWSERSMHRRLSSLYRRIGVQNRSEALAWLLRREQ